MQNLPKQPNDPSDNGRPLSRARDIGAFEEFVLWFALPRPEKKKLKLETMEQFAAMQDISVRTLGRWKLDPAFYPRLKELRDIWSKDRTSDVIEALYKGAISTGRNAPQDRKLWLQYVEGFSESQTIEQVKRVELSTNDIRFLIEGLPEPYKTQAYGHLRDISDLISAHGEVRHLSQGADGVYTDRDGSEDDVRREADHNAPIVPRQHRDAVAESHTAGVRGDLVGKAHSSDYQSTARWWEV